jgi:hypothetical protein
MIRFQNLQAVTAELLSAYGRYGWQKLVSNQKGFYFEIQK